MSVWYLDIDDEITDAVARLRAATDERVVLVVPPGSRIATGRINFRLLAREAANRELALAIVSPDAQVRALASAAGLPAHAAVGDAESALERGETATPEPEPPEAPEGAAEAATVVEARVLFAESEEAGADAAQVAAEASRRRRRRLGAAAGVAVGLVAIGGVASVTVLPSAQVSLVPRTHPLGPFTIAVRADPAAEAVDAAAGVVPAQRLEIPLEVAAPFRASGVRTSESRATGEVRFTSAGAPIEDVISARTRVRTPEGVEFDTTETVTLAPATDGSGAWVATAPVQAVLPGPLGNVPADAITIQETLASLGISVTNPRPTAGGSRQETRVVTQDDYDSAVVDLQNRLTGQLADRVRDPDPDTVPEGLTVFPATAARGEAVNTPAAEDVVGQAVEEFELRSQATGSVLAVDEARVADVALEQLRSSVPAGAALLEGTVETVPGTGTVSDGTIVYAASVEGDVYARLDHTMLASAIKGKPIDDARSILSAYGEAQLTVWPEFLGSVPDDAGRIVVTVRDPRPLPSRAP